MKDSLSFPLVLATVFVGALLAVFDPANRATSVAATTKPPAAFSPPPQPAALLASDMPS